MKRNYVLSLLALTALLLSGCSAQQKYAANTDIDVVQETSSDEKNAGKDTEVTDTAPTASTNPANNSEAANLTSDLAEEAALSHAGLSKEQVSFIQSKLDYEDGRQIYEVEFYDKDNTEYDYEIDAATGEVLSYSHEAKSNASTDTGNGSAVSADEAKALALSKVPGATENDIVEFETDFDHGRTEYEGKIFYDGVEYEFEINGDNGEITSWEVKR